MPRPIVFVARQIPDSGLDLLREHAEVRLHQGSLPPSRDELLHQVGDCDGILSLLSDRIDAEVMDAAGDQLKVISNFAVGYNNIDVQEARHREIAVGNTPDVLTQATADLAVALILATARRIREAWQDVTAGRWHTWEPTGWQGVELQEKTLGIVGMGRIGEAVASIMHGGWNMKIQYTARSTKSLPSHLEAAHVELETLLATSDVVSLHVPLSSQTEKLIGQEQLNRMKPNAILVNTARGEIVDQDALAQALDQKKILGAGLDVCTPEPLPTDNPLLKLDNCLVLPHIGSATVTARNAMATRAAENLIAGLDRRPLPYAV
ncbi:MAG: D-glycerate dehydrogenase [Aureliella sp.]